MNAWYKVYFVKVHILQSTVYQGLNNVGQSRHFYYTWFLQRKHLQLMDLTGMED